MYFTAIKVNEIVILNVKFRFIMGQGSNQVVTLYHLEGSNHDIEIYQQ